MYIKVNLHGVGVSEEFQFGVMFNGPSALDEDGLNEMAGNLTDHFASEPYADTLRSYIATDQRYDKFTLYAYAGSANLPAEFAAEGDIASADGVGTGGTTNLLQLACCVTLRSAFSGAHRRGRVYVPMTAVIPSPSHLFSPGIVDEVADTINAALIDWTSAWASVGGSDAPVPGIWSPTTSTFSTLERLSVDNRPDVQRRRANSQTPTHTASRIYGTP